MLTRRLVQSLVALAVSACATPPPKAAEASAAPLPEREGAAAARPAWPAGLTPCAKDPPEGSSCAAGKPAATKGAPADATTVWNVPIGPDDPVRGPADALVTLVVFSDFECPFCKKALATLDRLLTELPRDVRVVWKDLPLPMHAQAENAAELARFARAQQGDAGFWKAHDLLYAAQESLGEVTFRKIAGQLGLPWTPTWAGMHAARFGNVIQSDVALSDRVLVEATPTTFVNGIKLVGAQPYERTRELVDAELAKARARLDAGISRATLYAAIVSNGVQVDPHTDTEPP